MSWKQAASLATLAAQIGDVSNAGGMNVRDNVSSSRISGTNGTISSSRIHSGPFHGPFHYAKGPMYCMSSSLVQQLVTDRWLQAQVRAALAAPLHAKQGLWPFEDVFVGFALAHVASKGAAGAPRLLALDISNTIFLEEYGIMLSPGALLWHMKHKVPERIAVVDAWKQTHHCDVGVAQLRTRCDKAAYVACNRAAWQRCTVRYPRATTRNRTLMQGGRSCSIARRNLLDPGVATLP